MNAPAISQESFQAWAAVVVGVFVLAVTLIVICVATKALMEPDPLDELEDS